MRLLLDTHVLLWLLSDPDRIEQRARRNIEDTGNTVLLSAVSTWEIATKHALGKLALPEPPEALLARAARELQSTELPITGRHALISASLPKHHNDPFDRLLVAQAIVDQAVLATGDGKLRPYATQGLMLLWTS
jgi:PIN domain nuclease of toxin-antitoxin system